MEAPKTDFLFTTKAEATFRTSKATPLAVSPDNTAAFQAAIWDAARNAFAPTSHVAFTTACLDNGAAATVEVKEGRIVLTPNKEYLDQQAADVVVKVTYGVISTGTPDPAPGTGTFSVVLTADDDALVSQAATVGGFKAAGPTDNGKSTSPVRRLRGETRRIATRAPANTAPVLTANDPQPWASDPVLESTPRPPPSPISYPLPTMTRPTWRRASTTPSPSRTKAPAWLSLDTLSGLLTIAPDFTVASRLDNNGKSFAFPLTATDRAGVRFLRRPKADRGPTPAKSVQIFR